MKKTYSIFKKISAVVLSTILMFSVTACSNFNLFNTKNYDNDVEQIISGLYAESDNTSFADFADELFTDAVSCDGVTLHSYLQHPENYNIQNYEPTLGRYETTDLDDTSELVEVFNKLKSFDRATLSKKQQITYDQLMIYFENELEYSDLYLFGTDLCTTTGIHVQLPLILSEYTFLEEKDVKDYLLILKDTDEYFKSLTEYETLRSQNGYFMEDSLANQIIEECKSFMESASSGCLISTFEERLNTLSGISDTAKQQYIQENAKAVNEEVIKGYQTLIDGLTKLVGTNRYKGGLCNYPNGDKYFTYLLNHSLGWTKTIEEYDALLDTYINTNLSAMQTMMARDSALSSQFSQFSFKMTEPKTILEDLKVKIQKDFPEAVTGNYTIKYVADSLQDFVSPAMYFIPQLDNLDINSIYINPAETSDSDIYPTLAHEGYPGHLYQTTYFANTNPDLIRYLIAPDGYVEGWATYCELFSYAYADSGNTMLNALSQANYATILCLYAKCDIGINYNKWTESDVYSYISGYGFSDKTIAKQMYEAMISNPGNYCKYVLGWIGISELKKEAQLALGSSFTNKDFHKYVLDIGSVPLDILFDRLDQWIETAQYK